MNNAHHINDEAGAPGTGAPIVSPGAYPAKRATVIADDPAGDQPRARPHQRRDTVMTGRVSNAQDGEDVFAPGFAMLAALAARNGITLIALADGSYLLCKWGMSRALADLCVVASLLRKMGVSV